MEFVIETSRRFHLERLNISQCRRKSLLTSDVLFEAFAVLFFISIHGKDEDVVVDFAFADVELFISLFHFLNLLSIPF